MKKLLLLFECFFLVLTIITIKKTYGLFETESKEIKTEIQNLTSGKCTAEYIKDVKREKDI